VHDLSAEVTDVTVKAGFSEAMRSARSSVLRRAVAYTAGQGISQFLDIVTGIPIGP
jgi:hypothetical protein